MESCSSLIMLKVPRSIPSASARVRRENLSFRSSSESSHSMLTPCSYCAKASAPCKVSLDTGRYTRCTAGGRKYNLVVIKAECIFTKAFIISLFQFYSLFLIEIILLQYRETIYYLLFIQYRWQSFYAYFIYFQISFSSFKTSLAASQSYFRGIRLLLLNFSS